MGILSQITSIQLPPDFWTALAAIATAVQTIVVILAVIFALRQTQEVGRQLSAMGIIAHNDQLQRINELLLKPEYADLARGIGENQATAFASVLLNIFETWWQMKEQKLLDESEWKANLLMFHDMMQTDLLWKFWVEGNESPHQGNQGASKYYPPEFVKLIESMLPPAAIAHRQNRKSQPEPEPPQIHPEN